MDFNEKVLELVKKIPKGKVSTYKLIAKKLNSKAYRAVGTALKNNPFPIKIPCHRVVNSNKYVGNYSGKGSKIKLLTSEGIKIRAKKIENFNKVIYKF